MSKFYYFCSNIAKIVWKGQKNALKIVFSCKMNWKKSDFYIKIGQKFQKLSKNETFLQKIIFLYKIFSIKIRKPTRTIQRWRIRPRLLAGFDVEPFHVGTTVRDSTVERLVSVLVELQVKVRYRVVGKAMLQEGRIVERSMLFDFSRDRAISYLIVLDS